MEFGLWQIIYVFITGLALGMTAMRHGKPKQGKENFWETLIGVAIQMFIIYMGGFFG